jgi:hypothetical protein
MEAKKLIEDLKREVEDERNAIAVKEKLIANWEEKIKLLDDNSGVSMENIGNVSKTGNDKHESILGKEYIDLSQFGAAAQKKNTFIDDVRKVLKKFGDQQFTVNHINSILNAEKGGEIDASLKNKISLTLSKLSKSGEIVISTKGGGNSPHFYVNATDKEEGLAEDEQDQI